MSIAPILQREHFASGKVLQVDLAQGSKVRVRLQRTDGFVPETMIDAILNLAKR